MNANQSTAIQLLAELTPLLEFPWSKQHFDDMRSKLDQPNNMADQGAWNRFEHLRAGFRPLVEAALRYIEMMTAGQATDDFIDFLHQGHKKQRGGQGWDFQGQPISPRHRARMLLMYPLFHAPDGMNYLNNYGDSNGNAHAVLGATYQALSVIVDLFCHEPFPGENFELEAQRLAKVCREYIDAGSQHILAA